MGVLNGVVVLWLKLICVKIGKEEQEERASLDVLYHQHIGVGCAGWKSRPKYNKVGWSGILKQRKASDAKRWWCLTRGQERSIQDRLGWHGMDKGGRKWERRNNERDMSTPGYANRH